MKTILFYAMTELSRTGVKLFLLILPKAEIKLAFIKKKGFTPD